MSIYGCARRKGMGKSYPPPWLSEVTHLKNGFKKWKGKGVIGREPANQIKKDGILKKERDRERERERREREREKERKREKKREKK